MKKSIWVLAAALLVLAGCSDTNNGKIGPSPSPSQAAAVSQTIGAVDGITAQQVAFIDYYDAASPPNDDPNSSSPELPQVTYSKPEDIQSVLDWLSQIELTEQAEPQSTAVPGAWCRYEIKRFDGDSVAVAFAENTVMFDGGAYTYENPSGSDPSQTIHTYWMAPQNRSYPAGTEEIIVELFNQTSGEMAVTFVPRLEQAGAEGWTGITCQSEFCSSPDPVDTAVLPMAIDMKNWYPNSTPGIYRLTMDAYDEAGNPVKLSCIFELTEDA